MSRRYTTGEQPPRMNPGPREPSARDREIFAAYIEAETFNGAARKLGIGPGLVRASVDRVYDWRVKVRA